MTKIVEGLAVVGVLLAAASVASGQAESFSIDAKQHLAAGGGAVNVTGFVVCALGDSFNVTADVLQSHAGVTTIGAGNQAGNTSCTGAPQPFSVLVQVVVPANGEFKDGPANLLAEPTTFDSMGNFIGNGPLVTASVNLVH